MRQKRSDSGRLPQTQPEWTGDDPLCPRCKTPVSFDHTCYDSGCSVTWECLNAECKAMGSV